MKRITYIQRGGALLLLTVLLVLCLALPAAAAESRVYDPSGMLTSAETSKLAARLEELSAQSGVELYLATYMATDRSDDFYGDDYCTRVRNLKGTDAVLLVVTYEKYNGEYYYNMYTYGDANYDISQKEVDYILDRPEVYGEIKSGYICDGTLAFFEWSAKAYEGRVGAPWALVIVVSAAISLVIGLIVRAGVVASYRKKRDSVDYPLDRFAKLELTHEADSFVNEFVTRTYSPRSSSSGGGGGRHGGGGGHRGGR